MRSLQDEIRQAHRELSCPVCGRGFEIKDIQLRTFSHNSVVELSVICNRGHFPVILLVPITLKDVDSTGPISGRELKKIHTSIDALTEDFLGKDQ